VRTLPLGVGAGLVLGGAVGNLSERIVGVHGGQVPDFVTLDYWPTFNLADACVTIGIVIVIASLLFGPHETSPEGTAVTSPPGSATPDGDERPQEPEREDAP
jgi:signal peptidase II